MTASQWLEVLVSYSVQVSFVVSAAHLLDHRLEDSRTRSTIWTTCLWSLLLLGCCALLLPRLHMVQPWSWLQPQTILSVGEAQVHIGKLLVATWCLGASVALVRWICRGYLLRRILDRCRPLESEEVRVLLSAAGVGARGAAHPRVLVSDDIEGPFCWQLHRPTVVLPRFLLQGSTEDLSHVLAHELEHLMNDDPLQLFLQHAVQVVCWFHPGVWRAARHISLAREFACDDAAVAMGANTVAYLRILLRIAERGKIQNASLGFGRSRHEIVQRARRLVALAKDGAATQPNSGLRRRAAVLVLCAATLATSQLWLPVDALASPRAIWSPWPAWTATTLHSFGISVRDYERFDQRVQLHELREAVAETRLPHDQKQMP